MEYKALKDIATITMGQSPDSSSYNEEKNGIPFYQGNADFGELNPIARVWCSNPKKKAKKNDILISVRAPIGALNIATEECCIGRGLAAITIENDFERNYVFHLLKARNRELNNMGTGSTFKAISKSVLEEIQVPIISEKEQEIVMKLMDIIEETIHQRKQELLILDDFVKARFIEMFGDIVLNPFNWEKELLGMVCDVRDGTHDSPKYYETGYPLVTSKNVTGGKIDLTDCSLICEEDFKKINERSKVDIGDIIMPMIGTVGKPVIVDVEPNFAIKNVALIKFKDYPRVLNIFIRALLQSDYFDDAVLNKVRGGTQKFISLGDIRNLTVIVPPMELQKQFAAFVAQVDKSKSSERNFDHFGGKLYHISSKMQFILEACV